MKQSLPSSAYSCSFVFFNVSFSSVLVKLLANVHSAFFRFPEQPCKRLFVCTENKSFSINKKNKTVPIDWYAARNRQSCIYDAVVTFNVSRIEMENRMWRRQITLARFTEDFFSLASSGVVTVKLAWRSAAYPAKLTRCESLPVAVQDLTPEAEASTMKKMPQSAPPLLLLKLQGFSFIMYMLYLHHFFA